MATTAKGTPYVESSDLVANYPAVSLALAEHIDDFGGKVLQVVRATDTTSRSTSSTSYVDITGMSVTITPQKSDSAILLIFTGQTSIGNGRYVSLQITDSSNNAISGAEDTENGINAGGTTRFYFNLLARVAPGVTSSVTYKLRCKVNADTVTFFNNTNTAQMYAIEVAA